ncbi:hypothetical protein ABZ559_05190 [Streptococcus sp. ZY19097]|uniref:hypothetical protein n=1 Tax=Streptococcus sp. ZY19097 TaxID=3231906 RepID=UPI00345AF3E2
MANNIISCLDKDYKGKEKIFKITSLLVKIEFISIVIVFLFGNNFGKLNLSANSFTFIMIMMKTIIAFMATLGVLVLSVLSGTVDTPQDLENKRIARGVVRASNDEFLENMEKRRTHYKLKSREYIANVSYKRGRKKLK